MSKKNKKDITRIVELEVEEVSIVDKPANQRRFLAVKSEEGMTKGAEIVQDDQGNLVTSKENVTEEPLVKKDLLSPVEIFKAIGENIEKRLTVMPEVRKDIFQALNDSMSRLNTVYNATDSADVDYRGDKVSSLVPVLASEIAEISKELGKLAKTLIGVKKEDSAENSTNDEPLEKAGAKMSKERLSQFRNAMEALSKILTQLSGTDEVKKVQNSDSSEQIMKNLVEINIQLTEQIKKSNQRIQKLERKPNLSNVLPIEQKVEKRFDNYDVSWPMDLNDEKIPDKIDKSVSFFK
jgi:hypothetical protein